MRGGGGGGRERERNEERTGEEKLREKLLTRFGDLVPKLPFLFRKRKDPRLGARLTLRLCIFVLHS